MKVLFAVFLVVAGAYALPSSEITLRQERIVAGQIIRAIEEVSQNIKDAGLDPLIIDRFDYENTLIPFLVEVQAFLDQFQFEGASDIRVNNMDYNLLTNRLRFDVDLRQLRLAIGNSGIEALVFGTKYDASLSGRVVVNEIRLAGEVRVNIGIISGISIRSLSLQFTLGGIESALNLVALGNDYSNELNTALNVSIPDLLLRYRNEINSYLEQIVLAILEEIL